MKADIWVCALLGLANGSVLKPRKAQDVSASGYSDSYPKEDYPHDDYPKDDYHEDDYPHDEYPKDDYPHDEYPKDDYPHDDYPKKDYPHDDYPKKDYPTGGKKYDEDWKKPWKQWKPKTHNPDFFTLKVDDKCQANELANQAELCPLDRYAIRLEDGIVIATPYNKITDDRLPIFFVDSDTQTYTVSKKPLQLYIDTKDGALSYAPVGHLPANAISTSFFKLGKNALGDVEPSSAYFSWPSSPGIVEHSLDFIWWFCPLGYSGQYQVFASEYNFGYGRGVGVWRDEDDCVKRGLAAINANPWKKGSWY